VVELNHHKKSTKQKREVTPHDVFYHRYLQYETVNRKFSEQISAPLAKPEREISTDMVYGLPASGNCLMSKVAHELNEDTNLRRWA
jgi:hypothetical protein